MAKERQSDEETYFLHDIMDNSVLPKSGFRYLVALAPSYLNIFHYDGQSCIGLGFNLKHIPE